MKLDVDLKEASVSFSVARKVYSKQAIEIAAHIFGPKAEVYLDETKSAFALTLKPRRKAPAREDLERLGGEFVNELLNQEYRFLVGGFNQKISSLIVTQALLAARGGETPPAPPEGEKSPEFQAAVAALMKEAQDEIKRTMPKKLPPQGTVLPKAPEGESA